MAGGAAEGQRGRLGASSPPHWVGFLTGSAGLSAGLGIRAVLGFRKSK